MSSLRASPSFALPALAALLALALPRPLPAQALAQASGPPPVPHTVEIVASFPHDTGAFTQGLLYRDGFLYESTGLNGRSGVRKVELATGKVLRQRAIANEHFGEGLADVDDRLVMLTWQSGVGFVFDLDSFEPRREFRYPGEGWGLTRDGERLVMSDGTPVLRFLDPETLAETGRLTVTWEGQPLRGLNELEMVGDRLYANVWPTHSIVMIDLASGRVSGYADLSALVQRVQARAAVDVLNGIAWDADGQRLFVTGKLWPELFEIRLTPATGARP